MLSHKLLWLLLLLAGTTPTLADALIYDNGPFVNRPGQGPGGSDGSVLVYPMGDNGWPVTQNYGSRVADDFAIPSGQTWAISKVRFFVYQGGSPLNVTFPGMTLQIWNGQPNQAGSSLIWGDTSKNVLSQSGFTGAYRYNDGSPNTHDPIMWLDASVNLALPAGTYWLDWSVSKNPSVFEDVYQPPITIDGQRTTGNALWMNSPGNWAPALDIGFDGVNAPQGFPFQVYVPEPSVSGLVVTGVAVLFILRTRSRRAFQPSFRVFRG